MFLIKVTYKKELKIVDSYLLAHREFLQQEYDNNRLIVSGPLIPRTGGIILSQLKNRDEVESLIKQDPFYTQGIADYEIFEFDPVKYHGDFKVFL
jgi:uncharacterized protein YciI